MVTISIEQYERYIKQEKRIERLVEACRTATEFITWNVCQETKQYTGMKEELHQAINEGGE